MTHSNSPKTFRLLDLDGYQDDRLAGPAPALPSLDDSTHEGFVDLDYARQSFSLAAYHRHAVSLEHRPRCPVANTKCSLQSFSRETILGGSQVPRGFKPSRQRCPCFLQNRSSRYRSLMATRGANQTTSRLTPRFSLCVASRAAKSLRPSYALQVGSTRSVGGKFLHKFTVSVGENAFSYSQVPRHAVIRRYGHARQYTPGGANRPPHFTNKEASWTTFIS